MTRRSRPTLVLTFLLALVLGAALAPPPAARAATCAVTSVADSGPLTLRARLGNASCDTITFDLPGSQPWTITTLSALAIDRDVAIEGPGARQLTVLYGGGLAPDGRVFDITGGTVAISGLTIKGGRTDGGDGAGLRIDGGTTPADVTLRNVLVTDNIVDNGSAGGIDVADAVLTVIGSTISGNSAEFAGGGLRTISSTLAVARSTVTGNSAGTSGAGLYNVYGPLTVTGSTFSNNQVDGSGGGIFVFDATATLTTTNVSGNTAAGDAGGIGTAGGALTVTDSTISGNVAGDNGGGIENTGALVLAGTTVSDNEAGGEGGGLYNQSSSPVSVDRSTISGNAAGSAGGGVRNSYSTLALTTSTVSGNEADAGGGIANLGGTLNLTAVTLVGNGAAADGGGLFTTGTSRDPASMTLTRSVVAGNLGGTTPATQDCATGDLANAPLTSGGDNLVGAGCPVGVGNDLALAVPLAAVLDATLAGNGGLTRTHALVPNSPAIGLVPAARCGTPPTDQRGVARPQGAACDAGAYEFELLPQAIAFAPLPDRALGDPPFAVSATGGGSGNPVTFTAGPAGVCAAGGANGATITLVGLGTCTVTATQAGNASYQAAAPTDRAFTVAPPPPVALTVTVVGPGAVSPGSSPHAPGVLVTLVPQPAPGALFTGWTVDGTFQGWASPLTLTMDRPHGVVATFATPPAFADVPGGESYSAAVAELAARGYVNGYGDGTFGPGDETLRAQMAALIARALGYADSPINPFPDRCDPLDPANCIDDELWNRVAQLASRGIARGYTDAASCAPVAPPCYAPRGPVLHVQVLAFISRALVDAGLWVEQPAIPGLYGGVLAGTGHETDVATYLHYARAAGGIPDYPETGGFPAYDQPATRGWFARALWTALNSHWSVDRVP